MKRHLIAMLTLLPTLTLAGEPIGSAHMTPPQAVGDEARQSYIFLLHPDTARSEVAERAGRLLAREGGVMRHTFTTALRGFSATLPAAAASRIAQSPEVIHYEQNGIVQVDRVSDGLTTIQGGKVAPPAPESSQVVPPGIGRVGGPLDGSGKHAWVIDTGIDSSHADLNVGSGANFILRGKNSTDDGNGHGTHVAGIIAAIDNTIDVVGVAAGATLHPVRVLDSDGVGTLDGVIAGIDFVAANAAPGDVANMSLSGPGHSQLLHDAIVNTAARGVHIVLSAGNLADYAMNYEPAHIDAPNVYTVSAIDSGDRFATFSNWGNPPIDYAAPGVAILSTQMGGGTIAYSGTSMAAPHVAGLLLFATPSTDGYAINDPDGIADPIAHH